MTKKEIWENSLKLFNLKSHEKNKEVFEKSDKRCLNCNNKIPYEHRTNIFCNQSCSASFNNIKRIEKYGNFKGRKKTVKCLKCEKDLIVSSHASVKSYYCELHKKKKHYDFKKCKNCGFEFQGKNLSCSKNCSTVLRRLGASKGGKISATVQSSNRRSKNEIHFAQLCQDKLKNVKTNEPIFNGWDADVIIPEFKIAVLWNGNWHHKKITEKHSVKQVQNRDIIKLSEIDKFGYTPYIINDYGKENRVFVEEQFNIFINFLNGRATSISAGIVS
jgi:hypothetical protein